MQDTIQPRVTWQTENEIVVPVETQPDAVKEEVQTAVAAVKPAPVKASRIKARKGVPQYLAFPYKGEEVAVEAEKESVAEEGDTTVVADTLVNMTVPGEELKGMVIENPARAYDTEEAEPQHLRWDGGMSWIYLGLVVMFCAVGLKFKGNSRYMRALYTDLTDTRVRHNAFDETVKETSLLVLLNIVWSASVGILLWALVRLTHAEWAGMFGSITTDRAAGIGICIGVAAGYMLLMTFAYWMIGNVFSDSKKTKLWVKGAAASTALETFLLFPLALLTLVYPIWGETLLIISAGVLIFGKMVFLYKGFRIFFAEISSWLLFLYYLCSLEVVPLILCYIAAVALSASAA